MQPRIVPLLFVAALTAPAAAQFPGDVFFADPSPSVVQGTTVEMEVQAFSGALPLGAAAFEIAFDATRVAIDEVRPGQNVEFETAQTAVDLPGKTAIVVLNDVADDTPFGTVSLATLVVRPLVGAGETADFDITVKSVLAGDSSPFSSSQGFSATVTVTSSGSSPTQPSFLGFNEPLLGASWAHVGVAGAPRRLGHTLVIVRPVWVYGFCFPVPVEVRTIDLSAPADAR